MSTVALILAGGIGSRTGQSIPKQFLTVNDRPIIIYTLEAFQNHPEVDDIAVVCLKGWETVLKAYASQFNITKLKYIIPGGTSNLDSTKNGISELEKHYQPDDIVLIQDGNRPLTSADIISNCIVTTRKYGQATPVLPARSSYCISEDGISSSKEISRKNLYFAHTPGGFFLQKILDIFRRAEAAGITESISAHTLIQALGEKIYFYPSSAKNFKITTVEDIEIFKAILDSEKPTNLKKVST